MSRLLQQIKLKACYFPLQFDAYYSGRFSGRKLTWLHNYCHGELKFNYLKKPYIVNLATYLMGVLLCFNSNVKQTFFEISTSTGLPEKELLRQLQALCDAKILETDVSKCYLKVYLSSQSFCDPISNYLSLSLSSAPRLSPRLCLSVLLLKPISQ